MISKDIKQKLEKYAPKLGKEYEELEAEFNDILLKVKNKYTTLAEKDLPKKALDLLVLGYRRKVGGDFRYSKASMYEGWIDGASVLRDQVQDKIRRVVALVNREGRDVALLEELIDENGIPLDDRPNIFGRKKNPNYGKPLVNAPPAYIRTIYGVARKKGEMQFKPFSMTFFLDAAKALTFKTNKPCEFRATPGKNPNTLYSSDTTKFYPIQGEWDMDDIYQNTLGILIECQELESRMNTSNWDLRDVRLRVDVVNINPNPLNERGDKVMSIADLSIPLDEAISAFVPAHVRMNFGQDSKVVLTGRVRSYRGKPSLNVYGIWPIPGQVSFEEVEALEAEEIVDVGWVELGDEVIETDSLDEALLEEISSEDESR